MKINYRKMYQFRYIEFSVCLAYEKSLWFMTWTITAATLISVAIITAMIISFIYRLVSVNNRGARHMDATVCETLDYRNVSRNEWMSEIVDDIQEHGTPLDAIVFVDYIDGNDTESEYSRCLDYGIAIGYGDPKLGIVTNQISYVLRSEPLDGKSDNRLTELKCMSKRQNMVHAMSSGLKTIRNFYLANSSKMSDSEPEETFKISPSTIDPAAIKYVIR